MNRRTVGIVALALLFVLAFALPVFADPTSLSKVNLAWVVAKKLTVNTTSIFTGAVTMQSDLALTGDITQTGDQTVTGDISSTTLSVGGYPFNGAIRFGVVASAPNGVTVTHGFGVTPTAVLLTASATITQPLWVSAIATTTFTIGTPGGITVTNVYWMAGK